MPWTHALSTCGEWCRTHPPGADASCVDAARPCKVPWPGMSALVDAADQCSERCYRRFRRDGWEPSISEEVANQVGAEIDSLKYAATQVGMSAIDWNGTVRKYKEAKALLADLAARGASLPSSTRRQVAALLDKAQKVDRAIAASPLPADLRGLRGGLGAWPGGGLMGLTGLGVAPTLGAAAIVVAPWVVAVVAAGVVVVGVSLANTMGDVVSGSAKLKVCMSHSEDIKDPAQRAEFLERCGASGGLGLLGMIGLGVVAAGAGWLAWRKWGRRPSA